MPGSLTILYVDDNAGDRHLVETMVGGLLEDVTIETFERAMDALDRFDELGREIDCVVSDYHMPGMTGLDFLVEVRERDPDVPFILCTGHGSEDVASRAISAGVTDYHMKDDIGTYELLANRIKNAVESREARDELERIRVRFQALTENDNLAVITATEEGTIEYVSEAIDDIFGYEADDLVGEPVSMLVPERLRATHRAGIRRYVDTGERTLDWNWIELPGRHRDGHEISLGMTFGEAVTDGDRLFTSLIRDLSNGSRIE